MTDYVETIKNEKNRELSEMYASLNQAKLERTLRKHCEIRGL
jgi:hypothetical protein